MKSGIDWSDVRSDMEMQEWEAEDFGDGSHEERRVFLGTVFSLTPSGKYYMPWACSNVTEDEAEKDAEWYEAIEQEAEEHGYAIRGGEGDPCDLFAVEYRTVELEDDDVPDEDCDNVCWN